MSILGKYKSGEDEIEFVILVRDICVLVDDDGLSKEKLRAAASCLVRKSNGCSV